MTTTPHKARWVWHLVRFFLEIVAIAFTISLLCVAGAYCPHDWLAAGFGISLAIGFRAWKWAENFKRSRTITGSDLENDPELAAAVRTIGSRFWEDKPNTRDQV